MPADRLAPFCYVHPSDELGEQFLPEIRNFLAEYVSSTPERGSTWSPPSETLSVARSNVSNSLRELQGWGIVKVVHVMGDRRDHYESMKDVWEMFQIILDERKKRECDPTLTVLRELSAKAKKSGAKDAYTHERLSDMLGFFETTTNWYEQMRRLPTGALIKFVKMGDKIRKVLGFAS